METSIEYRGISNSIPEGLSCFKEEILSDTFYITTNNEILDINRFSMRLKASLVEEFNTPKGAFEDKKLTGIMGVTHIESSGTLEYLSKDNKLIIEKIKLSKKSYMVLPKDYDRKLPLVLNSYIQYLSVNKVSDKSFYASMLCLISL